ncbi:MAG: inorganic pyrophosphatase [Candidatus Promineifilaceae bacterium]|nr:inorganic pyrophosphatase [Candidatus Promineifilaceae bacterium]
MPVTPYFSWRPHPWHGLDTGTNPPVDINAYIEITPFDVVKYEIDKTTGYLRVDRPQRTSSLPPALYGFIPRTYCGNEVSALSPDAERGDGDPLDVFVVSERPIERSEVILPAHVVGAIRTVDGREADDKIVAVLAKDNFWGDATDISELPETLVARLRHYLSTYKSLPGQPPTVEIAETVHRDGALAIVEAAMLDYSRAYGDVR